MAMGSRCCSRPATFWVLMAIHALRGMDVRTMVPGTTGSYANFVMLATFLTGVMGFQLVGKSNSIPLPIAGKITGSMIDFPNQRLYMSGSNAVLEIPLSDVPDTSVSDTLATMPDPKFLAIRSQTQGLIYSGLYRISASSGYSSGYSMVSGSVTGTFNFVLNPMSSMPTGSMPDTQLSWTTVQYFYTASLWGNGAGGGMFDNANLDSGVTPNTGSYYTQGGSSMLRAIYQSPHPSGWQVRLCLENYFDRLNAFSPCFTVAPGFSGSASGDFQAGGPHLHGPQWKNSTHVANRRNVVGLDPYVGSFQIVYPNVGGIGQFGWRFYAWGDDATSSIFILNQDVQNAAHGLLAFGIPEDEPVPLPPHPVQRLFVVGAAVTVGAPGLSWVGVPGQGIGGFAYSLVTNSTGSGGLGPIYCTFAPWVYVSSNASTANGIQFDANAGDTPFLGQTELLPVDLIAGTWDNAQSVGTSQIAVMNLEPRRMGRTPMARFGRANYPVWTPVPSSSWIHTEAGVYLPWGS